MKSITPVAIAKALATIVRTVTNNPRANPAKLKPSQLLQLINSTPLGEVLTDQRLRQHRHSAGLRFGDGKSIDFVRYAAWHAVKRARDRRLEDRDLKAAAAYELKKVTERVRQAQKSRAGRELGEIPPCANPERKDKCRNSLRACLDEYFAEDFPLAWSEDQLACIREIERRVKGGQKAIAMPRGSGKTTILIRAVIWLILYGHRRFVALIGANKEAAEELLETIKTILETNERLAEDFPEVCVPIQEIGGINNRCAGQTYKGERTRISWAKKQIVLPTIAGSAASGVILKVSGILGRVRGMQFKTEEGTFRPDVVLLDDPQTDASARSDGQIAKRMKVMTGAILGLAGPSTKVAAFAAVTVIRVGDMADQILDKDSNPIWDGLRTKTLYGDAKNKDLIDTYWDMRADELRTAGGETPATNAWYRENQARIEEGLRAAWPERKNPDDVSAIQNSLNIIQDRGKDVFDAEYQNDPQPETGGDEWHVSAIDIAAKVNGLPRGIVPLWAQRLTAFTDVQQRLLYWGVAAWADNKRGALIDYGAWPGQVAREFNYKDIRLTLAKKYPKRGIEGAIRAGLGDLADHLLARDWKREDGNVQRIERWGIDAGNWTSNIHEFVRTHKMAALIMPCKGKGVMPNERPISEWRKKPTEMIGEEWIMAPQPKHASRLCTFDTNYWKRQLFLRFASPLGEPSDLSLFGTETVLTHRMLATQCHAESFEKTSGHGRDVYVFREKPGRPDNHLFDVATGCMVMTLPGLVKRAKRPVKRKATYL